MYNQGVAWLDFFETASLWLEKSHSLLPFLLPIRGCECDNLSPYVFLSLLSSVYKNNCEAGLDAMVRVSSASLPQRLSLLGTKSILMCDG